MVDDFIQARTGQPYNAQWMIAVTWDQVHPWPHGGGVPALFLLIFPDYILVSWKWQDNE